MSPEQTPPAGHALSQRRPFQVRCPQCGRRIAKLNSGCPVHRPLPQAPGESNFNEYACNTPEIPGYRVTRLLGMGGFGTIFEAERAADGRKVALKIARPDQPLAARRLVIEGHALKNIGAPFVPELFEIGTLSNGSPFLAMEYIEAPTLAERFLDFENPLTVDTARALILAVLSALSAVHQKGYAHCDLKPENIFLEGGSVRLIDFGLATHAGQGDPEPSQTLLLGTAEYMSPEQCEGRADIELRSDLYSVGILLFEILAGKPPFWGSPALVQQHHRNRRPPRLSSIAVIPPSVDDILSKCLAKDPSARHSSAEELKTALEEAFRERRPVRRATPAAGFAAQARRMAPAAPREAGQHRRAGLLFFESEMDALSVEKRIRMLGGHLAYASNRRFVAIYSHDVGGNPAIRAVQAAGQFVKSGVCQRALVDLSRALVQTRSDGSQRFLSPLFFKSDQYPSNADPIGVFLAPTAADAVPNSEGAMLPARGWIHVGAGAGAASELDAASAVPLFGRGEILSTLKESAEACISKSCPAVLCLTGEEGSGKSRIAQEFRRLFQNNDRNERLILVQARNAAGAAGETPLGQILAQLLRAPDRTPEDKGRAFICERLGLSPQTQDWAAVALCLGFLSAGAPELSAFEAAAGSLRNKLVRIAAEFLRKCASASPLLILIDNAHHSDEITLNALEYAALAEANVPLWILALGRPAFTRIRPNWGERAASAQRLGLPPLDAADAVALCRHLLLPAEDIPEAAVRRLSAWANGMPGLLIEVVRALKREGVVRKSLKTDRFFVATDEIDRTGDLPLAEWFAQREIASLTPSLQAFARFVALLGGDVAISDIEWIVKHLHPEDAPEELSIDAGVGLQKLLGLGILVRQAAGDRVEFRHPLVKEALARAIPAARRVHIHRAAHEYFRTDRRFQANPRLADVAFHAAGAGLVPEAISAWMELANDFQAKHLYLEAESSYSKAIELSKSPILDAYRGRGIMRYRLGRYGDALSDFDQARGLAEEKGDKISVIELLLDEAMALDWLSEFKSAAERVERGQALAGDKKIPSGLRAKLLLGQARSAYRENRHEEAERLFQEAAALARSIGESEYETLVIAESMLGYVLQGLNKLSEASEALSRAIELSEARHDTMHLGTALNIRALLRSVLGDEAGMISDLERVISIGRELAQRIFEIVGNYNLAEHYYFTGQWEKAAPLIEKAVDIDAREAGGEPRAAVALMHARVLLYQMREGAALAAVRAIRRRDEEARAQGNADQQMGPSDEVFCKMIELYGADAPDEAWDELEAQSIEFSVGQERLEVLETRALSMVKQKRVPDAIRILERAMALSNDIPNAIGARIQRRILALSG